jgi:phosphatidylglycerophosphatase A
MKWQERQDVNMKVKWTFKCRIINNCSIDFGRVVIDTVIYLWSYLLSVNDGLQKQAKAIFHFRILDVKRWINYLNDLLWTGFLYLYYF